MSHCRDRTSAGAPGFMLTLVLLTSDWSEVALLVGELPPETLLWDLDLLRSASVPGGEWKLVELLLTRAGFMVTDTWMLIGSCADEDEFCLESLEVTEFSSTDCLLS